LSKAVVEPADGGAALAELSCHFPLAPAFFVAKVVELPKSRRQLSNPCFKKEFEVGLLPLRFGQACQGPIPSALANVAPHEVDGLVGGDSHDPGRAHSLR